MSKSYVQEVLGLYGAILADCSRTFPAHQKDCERDYHRLATLAERRGLRLFTVDLPDLGKHLESALRSGRLERSYLPLTGTINNSTVIPKLFQGLWCGVFDRDGCLKQGIDPASVFFLRQLCYAVKKLRLDCPPKALYKEIKEYYDVEAALPPAGPFWEYAGDESVGDLVDRHRSLRRFSDAGQPVHRPSLADVISADLVDDGDVNLASDLRQIQQVADELICSLGEFFPEGAHFRHGPGAVADGDQWTYKYRFPNWPKALADIFPADIFAQANGSVWEEAEDVLWNGVDLPDDQVPSVLIAVPKTQKSPRLIAKESIANQWCQQSIKEFLYRSVRLTHFGNSIDFTRQDISRELALSSSLDGYFCTMDLKSASDRISCWLVERIFRSNWSLLYAFRAVRSQYIRQDVDKKSPKLHMLRKFSCMGSALTFPVQSLVFTCLLAGIGSILEKGKSPEELLRQVRVFGDDLIFPKTWEPVVTRVFEKLWLRVNHSKTHAEGNFRESCGMDAFMGYDVTPGYVLEFYDESTPTSLVSVVDVRNNLFRKGLWRTAAYLLSTVPDRIKDKIPFVEPRSGAFGLITFSGSPDVQSRNRWNKDLHRWEALVLSVSTKRVKTLRHEGRENLLQFFTEDRPSSWWEIPSGETETGITGSRPSVQLRTRWVPVSDFADVK